MTAIVNPRPEQYNGGIDMSQLVNKRQIKSLPSTMGPSFAGTILTSLTFNNLVIGKTYRVTMFVWIDIRQSFQLIPRIGATSGGTQAGCDITHQIWNNGITHSVTKQVSFLYTPSILAGTTLGFEYYTDATGSTTLRGDGTPIFTHVLVEELLQNLNTIEWN